MPIDFGDGQGLREKLWVALGHSPDAHLYCLKTTSQLDWYKNRPETLSGVVVFKANALACFPEETVIQLNNAFPFPYSLIQQSQRERTFALKDILPAEFARKFKRAFDNSIVLDGDERERIEAALARPVGVRP
jgi:hypothetical protein